MEKAQAQYFCSRCDTPLEPATAIPPDIAFAQSSSSEQCPSCGYPLSETLCARPVQKSAPKPPRIQIACDMGARLTLGIEEIDRLVDCRAEDRLCLAGSHANLLLSRLCVRALMPRRQGGLSSGSVLVIDAGNSSDFYQCINFARQYGMDVDYVSERIVVSRAFTIYQLAGLMVHELPRALERHETKILVISDVLRMFAQDPQVSAFEAKRIIGEVRDAIHDASKKVMVLASLETESAYDNLVLPLFNKRMTTSKASKDVQISLYNGAGSREDRVAVPEQALKVAARR